ncbi:hypothetical protein SLEP1_g55132 [Rubroshorea leprosula]|uniref:Uncharacterized protein n=1 Tax=Rubroshorea leprosula TaxID=152421 RepID=A0AAV5MEH3_9ROSI|nr:hypothetical protein SLEP1_g55122 [Rubroshorea leprosula]GKV48308.1 hypothetical protein SLEP1_g55132 [Rubroshorea leprosula]
MSLRNHIGGLKFESLGGWRGFEKGSTIPIVSPVMVIKSIFSSQGTIQQTLLENELFEELLKGLF